MDFQQLMARVPANYQSEWTLVTGNINVPSGPGVPFRWSASQVSNFEECPRKWFFDKIEKRPRVEKLATYFGSIFHEFREEYFHTGKQPDEKAIPQEKVQKVAADIQRLQLDKGNALKTAHETLKDAAKLAKLGLVHLPMPQMFVNKGDIERKLTPKTSVGQVVGYIDFFLPDQGAVGYWPREVQWHPTNGVPLVGDHKSTAGKKYIKTIEDLAYKDPQPALYGKAALDWTGSNVVDFLWHYNVKKGKKEAVPVRFRLPKDHIEDRFGKTEETARKMLSIFDSGGTKAQDVEPNPSACDNYGGCPHREYCPLSNQQKLGALMNGPNTAFEQAMNEEIAMNGNNQNPALNAAQQSFAQPVQQQQQQMQQQMPPQQQQGNFMPPAAPAMPPQQMQQMPPQQQMQPPMQQQQPPMQQPPMQQQQPPMQQPPMQQAAPSAPPPASAPAVQTTLADMGAAVNPPDAAAADLNATLEDTKKKKAKKASAKEKEFRNTAALQIYAALVTLHGPGADNTVPRAQMVSAAVNHADALIEELGK